MPWAGRCRSRALDRYPWAARRLRSRAQPRQLRGTRPHPKIVEPATVGDRGSVAAQVQLSLQIQRQHLGTLGLEDWAILSKDPVLELDHWRPRLIVHSHPHPGRAVDGIVWRYGEEHPQRVLAMLDE